MKKYIIERNVPGAGKMTAEELQEISRISVATIAVMGRPYTWLESYVTDDKLYCIHEAEDEAAIYDHGKCGNFPVNCIQEIVAVISPATAKEAR